MPPPFGTEQALKVELTARLAHVATLTHLHINDCFMSCKHKALKYAATERQRWHYTVVDSEGKGLRDATHTTNCQSYSPVAINFAWLWWSPMASEALSYGLNSKIFLGEHQAAPRPPTTLCVICARKKLRWLCAPHSRTK